MESDLLRDEMLIEIQINKTERMSQSLGLEGFSTLISYKISDFLLLINFMNSSVIELLLQHLLQDSTGSNQIPSSKTLWMLISVLWVLGDLETCEPADDQSWEDTSESRIISEAWIEICFPNLSSLSVLHSFSFPIISGFSCPTFKIAFLSPDITSLFPSFHRTEPYELHFQSLFH